MAYYDNYRGDNNNNNGRYNNEVEDEVFSVPVKAGKRIYYFDVRATRGDDYYVTITESRKKPTPDGGFFVDRHKIFLYKEDFQKFAAGLEEVLNYVRREKPDFAEAEARGEYNKPFEQREGYEAAADDTEKQIFGDL